MWKGTAHIFVVRMGTKKDCENRDVQDWEVDTLAVDFGMQLMLLSKWLFGARMV